MSTLQMLKQRYPTNVIPMCNLGFELGLDDNELKGLKVGYGTSSASSRFMDISDFMELLIKVNDGT